MKQSCISLLFLFFLALGSGVGTAQNVNWKETNPENKNLIYANVGFQYGSVASVGYGYRINTIFPILVNAEISAPFGDRLFDDLKSRLGGQIRFWQAGRFSAAVKVYGVYRRYESDFVRLSSFGSETDAVFGFYQRKWYAAAEIGFDKAITTQVKHSRVMLDNNPSLRNGWYVPTGGNFNYGIQTGLTFRKSDVYLSVGKMVTQDFKTTPTIPLYFQLGYGRRF